MKRRRLAVSSRSMTTVLALCLLCVAAAKHARAQATGELAGVITDSQGGRLVGVTVTAASDALDAPRVRTSGPDGAYAVDGLPPGDYRVIFELDRFRTLARMTTITSNRATQLDVTLDLAAIGAADVEVVAVTPMAGSAIDARRVPANVRTLDASDLQAGGARSLAGGLDRALGSATVNDTTANPHQPDLRFRGFTASPLLGLPQGLAIYQNGVRVNESFGDTIQFDLIPDFAVRAVQLIPGASPVFGLNALGGAIALELANGLDSPGARIEVGGGSFGRGDVTAEYGYRRGNAGVYLGASRRSEAGWRDESGSEIVQLVGDVVRRTGRAEVGVTATYANTDLDGNGPAPVELLAADRTAVFTFPDTTRNELGFFQGRTNVALTDTASVQANAYLRDLRRNTLNGDAAELGPCAATGAVGLLCSDEGAPLIDRSTGRFVTQDLASGSGVFNRTTTQGTSYGASGQARVANRWFGRSNLLLLGAAFDASDVSFSTSTEIGTLTATRTVARSGIFVGVSGEFPDDPFNTGLTTDTRHRAVYLTDTWSLADRLHVTAAARYTRSRIDIIDTQGTRLDGAHTFDRLNPSIGATVQLDEGTTVFASYGESSRTPTAAELSCADPEEPCRVPNAFISDPPLGQVVSRTIEAGARGRFTTGSIGTLDWSAAWYRSRIADDIIFVASPTLVGTGFFQNAGTTARRGLEIDVRGTHRRLRWHASYAASRATFESPLVLPGNPGVNDAATADGRLLVEPGDRLPGVPAHGLTLGVSLQVRGHWTVGADARISSSRRLLGDEGNDQRPVPGYGIVNLRSTYRMTEQIEVVLTVTNLFDTEYETFGALAEVEVPLREAPRASIPRFLSPGAPIGAWVGLRLGF